MLCIILCQKPSNWSAVSHQSIVDAILLCALQVKHIESMRRDLPADCSMIVTKNRLLRVAVDSLGDEGAQWHGLKGQKGMNAYVFAPEDSIRGAVLSYSKLLDTLKVGFPRAASRGCTGRECFMLLLTA